MRLPGVVVLLAVVLGATGSTARGDQEEVQKLIAALGDDDASVRSEASKTLVYFGTELAIAGVIATQHMTREQALVRLGQRFREEADRMVPALLRMARGKRHD